MRCLLGHPRTPNRPERLHGGLWMVSRWSGTDTFHRPTSRKLGLWALFPLALRLQSVRAMKKLAWLLVVPLLVCALAGEGLAEESAPKLERRWYGWQTLLADGLSFAAVTAGAMDDSPMPMLSFLGAAGYLAAPAAIHGVHGHGGLVASSVLLRIGLPAIGGMLGASMADCSDDEGLISLCPLGETVLGAMVGMGAAVVVDAVMAWDTRPPAQPTAPPPTRSSTIRSLPPAPIPS